MKGTTMKAPNEFPLLDPEITEAIPDLNDPDGRGKPMFEAAALRERLKNEKRQILLALNRCSCDSPMGPASTTNFDSSADAEALLTGVAVGTLTAPIQETERSSLLRQLRATECAIPLAENGAADVENDVIQAACEDVRPVARDIIQDTVAAAQHFLSCLEAQEQFFTLLARRGLRTGRRPPWLNSWPQEIGLLRGDIHRPPLGSYIKSRCESAGIPKPSERK
jgi:hypothetical protein